MNVSAPFILRPIATTLLMVGLSAVGLVAYALLPIAGVPQVDIPTIQVTAHLPGASAETMATSVAGATRTTTGADLRRRVAEFDQLARPDGYHRRV
jgi:multidrug efflux pump subunit AcrB